MAMTTHHYRGATVENKQEMVLNPQGLFSFKWLFGNAHSPTFSHTCIHLIRAKVNRTVSVLRIEAFLVPTGLAG